jgi:hypothetical protein
MRPSGSFYLVARRWMQYARQERARGNIKNMQALVKASRDYVRVGRVWQYELEREY